MDITKQLSLLVKEVEGGELRKGASVSGGVECSGAGELGLQWRWGQRPEWEHSGSGLYRGLEWEAEMLRKPGELRQAPPHACGHWIMSPELATRVAMATAS